MAELASTAEQIENAVRYDLGTWHAKVQPKTGCSPMALTPMGTGTSSQIVSHHGKQEQGDSWS